MALVSPGRHPALTEPPLSPEARRVVSGPGNTVRDDGVLRERVRPLHEPTEHLPVPDPRHRELRPDRRFLDAFIPRMLLLEREDGPLSVEQHRSGRSDPVEIARRWLGVLAACVGADIGDRGGRWAGLVARVSIDARYGQRVIAQAAEWHDYWTYEWWRDIGTGLLTVTAAVLVGASTLTVAIRSHLLSRAVTAREAKRIADERSERYDGRLTTAVERAIERLVDYLDHSVRGTTDQQIKRVAAVTAVTMVQAVARGNDNKIATAAGKAFTEASASTSSPVRSLITGEVMGVLSAMVARREPASSLLAKITSAVARAEASRQD